MAKSIRSKHRRQMRNIKRQHYAKKDLEKLKKIAEKSSEIMDVVTMKTTEEMKEKLGGPSTQDDATMDVDKVQKVYDKKTKKDENGQYCPWMNQRAIKKQKQKLNKAKKKVGKKIKW